MIGHERSSQISIPPPPASPAATALNSSRRRFSRAGRKHSNGSVQSSSSSGTARSAEIVGIRQPAKSRIRRQQQRLSAVFGRGARGAAGEMSTEEAPVTDDPSELSNHITAPGILKIFGTEICEGANYKSVLATTHSSAGELVKEALARYSLSKADADDYVLCDVIGCVVNHSWRTECVRVVGDQEKPLLLQSLWKPKEGFARRFEIQRKTTVEEHNSRDKDTVTAGINAQARKLVKTRSRGKSVPLDVCVSDDGRLSLFKSLSETDLTAEALSTCTHGPDPGAETYKESQCAEREETESSDDNCTQYCIHPPLHFPYLLLLQGFSGRQDLVIYGLMSSCTVFGRHVDLPEAESDVETVCLWAPDLLERHCCVRRLDTSAETLSLLKPLNSGRVKRNGAVVDHEVELQSGDIIAFGDHYLFMYKDPSSLQTHRRPLLCHTCVLYERPRAFRDLQGEELALVYEVQHEPRVLKEIFRLVEQDEDAHRLTAAFLLCLCLQRSVIHFSTSDLRRLMLHTANHIQMTVWEKAKELAALQAEISSEHELIGALEPLVLWMSNSLQILHFVQQEVPRLLREEQDSSVALDPHLSCVHWASEETVTVLEEVLLFTFQQCVYYITKVLYALLPALLDGHAFSESGQLQVSQEVRRVLDVFMQTLKMLREAHVHPEIRSQLFSYLFFFINALLFNLLMERGSGGGFYCWSRGVQIRANLDVLMDWSHGAGLADLAHHFLLKLSSAVNLLATPRENLLQMSWTALRLEFPSLNASQLQHILNEYGPQRCSSCSWTPSGDEACAAHRSTDLLEGFDDHPPLVLPVDGYTLQLRRPMMEISLIQQLQLFQKLIQNITGQCGSAVPMEAKRTKIEVPPKAHLELGHTELMLPHAGDLSSCEALLTKKLQNLALQNKDVDPSCLLTPPNTPLNLELSDSDTDADSHTNTSRIEQGEECAVGDDEDVFVLELQRAACGLGLLLVDGEEASSSSAAAAAAERVVGIFIKSVLPDSPAALSERLRAGDRILAVNGLSLAGVDYQTGMDVIQASGERPRLLVSRSHCTGRKTDPV